MPECRSLRGLSKDGHRRQDSWFWFFGKKCKVPWFWVCGVLFGSLQFIAVIAIPRPGVWRLGLIQSNTLPRTQIRTLRGSDMCSQFVLGCSFLSVILWLGLNPAQTWAGSPRRESARVTRKAAVDSVQWVGAVCPVAGLPVRPAYNLPLYEGWVAFSSEGARKEFEKHRSDHLEEAHSQLVLTGQYRQVRCPQSGRSIQPWSFVAVNGLDVYFADDASRRKFLDSDDEDRANQVLGKRNFTRCFAHVPVEEQASRKRLATPDEDPSDDDPRTEEDVARINRVLFPAMQAQDRNWKRLMDVPDVIGHTSTLDANGKPVIQLLLKESRPGQALPREVDGIPVISEVVGELVAMQGDEGGSEENLQVDWHGTMEGNPRWCARPVPIGVSTGVSYPGGNCNGGTIACRLRGFLPDGTPAVFLLSCNHVLAGVNLAPLQSHVLQPAKVDNGCFEDLSTGLGNLTAFKQLQFGGLVNRCDVAIVVTDESLVGNSTPADGYGTPSSVVLNPTVGMLVQKYGRTTKRTYGRITGVNTTVVIMYSAGSVLFTGQITVANRAPSSVFTQPGDSGSLMVSDPGRNPVGLLMAGNSTGTVGICNRFADVLEGLNLYQLTIDVD